MHAGCSHQHKDEGFALDWSRVAAGRLAAGDCAKAIHVWEPRDGGFAVSAPYRSAMHHALCGVGFGSM